MQIGGKRSRDTARDHQHITILQMIQAHEQPIRLTIADMLDLCLFR